ncbi:malate synthase [Paenibacillus sp. cl6col]|uniref:Malate synthase n=1 Tax=Paenibacillus alvei TaxID=44250 RepID=A0ABT4EEJ2_PAEAL|nr:MULTISPECIES: malate synthase A [Paenibacillus]MCY9532107.1 malate synthase A [Paenibacillus alvei]SDE52829.1 malate synthase [Paenibacillus sp. cl6col]
MSKMPVNNCKEIVVLGHMPEPYAEILTPGALEFLGKLHERFNARRLELLSDRAERQRRLDAGELPDFLPETKHIRDGEWSVAPVPSDLQDRRVEITGPSGDAKMVINALNSGAKGFMADFEDANSPTWDNSIRGQINMRDAIRRTITFTSPEGKAYRLNEQTAYLLIRPRGWHLEEKHIRIGEENASGSLVDFGLYFYHNARTLIENQSGPYFYLPKLESHQEAKLWNDVFVFAQQELGIPQGTIKATVLIETILATFEADEILYELREHSAGLNCGRWDYIFSFIKRLNRHRHALLPDRSQVTMTVPFMRAYTQYVIRTCHKRDAHAMGGMAAQIPIRNDTEANAKAMEQVRADKQREANDGHDGTWVAHPGLVPIAMEIFNEQMKGPNQLQKKREDVRVTASDLLALPEGTITEQGLRTNISVGLQYIEAWLRGFGAVPIFNLMEDAATAEISRTQVWQWIRHPEGRLTNGNDITLELVLKLTEEEMSKIKESIGQDDFAGRRFTEAKQLFVNLISEETCSEFLTVMGYELLG